MYACVACTAPLLHAQQKLTARVIASNLDTPWGMAEESESVLWVTERKGRILRLQTATGETRVMLDLTDTVMNGPEAGLLGITLHPAFPDSPYVYTTFVYRDFPWSQPLMRYTFNGDSLVDPQALLVIPSSYSYHAGARIEFGSDTTIFMCTGDGTDSPLSQNLESLQGKVLRIRQDGSIPDDNPFVNSPVYAYGLRNPQGLTILPNGRIFTAEHGPSTDDEVNQIVAGGNYGWPHVEGRAKTEQERNYKDSTGAIDAFWTTGSVTYGIGPIAYYSGTAFREWNRSLLVGSLKDASITVLHFSRDSDTAEQATTYLTHAYGRIRDIVVLKSGRVLFCTSNRDGRASYGYPRTSDDHIYELIPLPETSIALFDEQGSPDTLFANTGDTLYHTFKLRNSGDAAATVTEWFPLSSDSPDILPWRWTPSTWIAPEHPCPFPVRITPSRDTTYTLTMVFRSVLPFAERHYSVVVIPLKGDVTFEKDLIEVEGIVGERTPVDISVFNPTVYIVEISSVEVTGLSANEYFVDANQFPIVIQPGASAVIRVWFAPNSLGDGKVVIIHPVGNVRQNREVIIVGSASIVSVHSDGSSASFSVAPNPASSQVLVSRPASETNLASIQVFSALGRTVLDAAFPEGSTTVTLHLNGLQPGFYTLSIHDGTALHCHPLVIQR